MKALISSTTLTEPPAEISDVNTIVIKDNFNNPIFVAIHQTPDSIWSISPDDPRFSDIVEGLGITKRVKVLVENN